MYIPLDVILSFPAPNYENPASRGHGLIVLNVIFTTLLIAAVAGRLYARIYLKRWFGWDDGFIVLAALAAIGFTAGLIVAYEEFHWDRHVWDIPFAKIPNAIKTAFAIKLMFTASISLTRLSLACFYYRLVRSTNATWFKYTLHASTAYIVVVGFLSFFLSLFACRPISTYWMIPEPKGSYCMNDDKQTLALGVINCSADLLITLVPVPLILKLQMPLRQRICVAVLLGLGFNVTIAGIVRTYYIWRALFNSWDTTWESYPLWYAATVEVDLAVICACAPAIRSIFPRAFIRTLSSKIRSIIPMSSKTTSAGPGTRTSRSFRDPSEPKLLSQTSTHGGTEVQCIELSSTHEGIVPRQQDV